MDKYFNFELDDLSDKVGEFIHYWGFKKIHGKVWCHLYLSKVPLDAATLQKRLNVSKALVSQTLTELIEYSVVESIGKGEGRTELYVAHRNILNAIVTVLRNREKRLLANIFSSFRNLQSINSTQMEGLQLDPCKINQLGRMIVFAEKFLSVFINFEILDFSKFKTLFQKKEGP